MKKPRIKLEACGRRMRRLVSGFVNAPAPRWMVRLHLRLTARKLHACADEILMHGDYDTAVEIRTLAFRVGDSANVDVLAPAGEKTPTKPQDD